MATKTLVAYFSVSGNTRDIAKSLAKAANADLTEIEPTILYTRADLDWHDENARSTKEMKNPSYRPSIKLCSCDPSKYDRIFLGFPIWWYVAPTIINTFLESFDTSNKSIILFATSGGSDFGKTLERLETSCKPSTKIVQGEVFNGNPSVDALKSWLKEHKY